MPDTTTMLPTTTASLTGGCVPCGTEFEDFQPECPQTTRALQTTVMNGTVLSENEELNIKCEPMAHTLPKIDVKICNCVGQVLGFKLTDLPDSANGVVKILNTPVNLNDVVSEDNNGALIFTRVNPQPFTDTVKYVVMTTCGDSAEYTLTITAKCICVENDECETCQECL